MPSLRGRVMALQESWAGRRVIEFEGSLRVTPNEVAATFAKILGRPVRMEAVPRDSWEGLFAAQGTKNPTPRAQMLDGFNAGWIEFEAGEKGSRKGVTALETVLRELVARGRNGARGRRPGETDVRARCCEVAVADISDVAAPARRELSGSQSFILLKT
jgi:hypothetical protein